MSSSLISPLVLTMICCPVAWSDTTPMTHSSTTDFLVMHLRDYTPETFHSCRRTTRNLSPISARLRAQSSRKLRTIQCGRVNLNAQVITPSGRCSRAAPIVAQPNANAGRLGIRLKVGQTSGEVMRLIKLRHARYDYSGGSARGFLRSAVMLDDAPAPA